MSETPVAPVARSEKEAAFHDARIEQEGEQRLSYAYTSVGDVYEFTQVPGPLQNLAILELGCFRGDRASSLREQPVQYRGIDISSAAIEYCQALSLPDNFVFTVDDANALGSVPDASIDYAFGQGVLHHLELPRFAQALAQKLKPDGCARFVEPAQGNWLLRAFRKLTPHLRTDDERPFDQSSIDTLQQWFDVSVRYQALLRPLLPMLAFNVRPAVRLATWLDDCLLRIPALQSQAWLLQIELRPKRRV